MNIWSRYSFLCLYFLLPLPLLGYMIGGWGHLLTLAIVFLIIPSMDFLIPDKRNPTPSEYEQLLKDQFFWYILYAYVLLQAIFLAWVLYLVSLGQLAWYEWLLFAISVGIISGGLGINIAHELLHKPAKRDKFLSQCLLAMVCYGHFFIEHPKGHHVWVGTPRDPATARFNESIYQFLPRTIIGSAKSAWQLEKTRLGKLGQSVLSRHNQFIWIISVPLLIVLLTFFILGPLAALFFLLQSVIAFVILEIVNYVEHYGLTHKKIAGRYEPFNTNHAWDADRWLSNHIIINLQRHTDHHLHPIKPYQNLLYLDNSPKLPSGYPGMIMLALIPPLWFKVMNPRLNKPIQTSLQS